MLGWENMMVLTTTRGSDLLRDATWSGTLTGMMPSVMKKMTSGRGLSWNAFMKAGVGSVPPHARTACTQGVTRPTFALPPFTQVALGMGMDWLLKKIT